MRRSNIAVITGLVAAAGVPSGSSRSEPPYWNPGHTQEAATPYIPPGGLAALDRQIKQRWKPRCDGPPTKVQIGFTVGGGRWGKVLTARSLETSKDLRTSEVIRTAIYAVYQAAPYPDWAHGLSFNFTFDTASTCASS